MSSRYGRAGRLYDVVSLERVLYRRPRSRLLEMLGPMPGATVVDIGCGTGLNFPGLSELVAPDGAVVGVDPAASMVDAARRRVRRSGWSNVTVVHGDAAGLLAAARAAGIERDAVGAVVATFALSVMADDVPVWAAIDVLSTRRAVRVAVADLGRPDAAPPIVRPVYRMLTAIGGGDPDRRPWEQVVARAVDGRHEIALGGHVHLAAGTFETGREAPTGWPPSRRG